MVKDTKNRHRGNIASKLSASEVRRVFVQCQMGANLVVVSGVGLHDSAQVGLDEQMT